MEIPVVECSAQNYPQGEPEECRGALDRRDSHGLAKYITLAEQRILMIDEMGVSV